MRLVDSHCHLDAPEFAPDRAAVLARAAAAGVHDLVIPAVQADDFAALDALCRGDSRLHPAYGLHPMYLRAHQPLHLDQVADFLARGKAVAVGECGLDFFVPELDPDHQRGLFQAHLKLARDFDLPLILHARRAVDEVIGALRRIGGLRGVVHSFSGSEEQAQQLYRLGFFLGIGGPVTYPRAQRLRRIVAHMPIEFLLLESDAPDQPDCDRRGERNEPAFLRRVLAEIALLRGQGEAEIAQQTRHNAARLFSLVDRAKALL